MASSKDDSDSVDRHGPVQPGTFAAFAFGLAPAAAFAVTWISGSYASPPSADPFRALAVPIVAAEILAIILAVREGMISRIRWSAAPAPLYFCLTAWACIALGTAVWAAPAPATAIVRTAILFVHLLFGMSVLYLCSAGRRLDGQTFANALLIGFIVFLALFLAFIGFIEDWRRYDWKERLPAFPQLRQFSYLAAAMIGLCLGRMAETRDWRRMTAITLVAAAAFWLAFWTGGRGAIASVLGAVLAGFVIVPSFRRKAVLAAILVSLAAGWAAAAAMPAAHGSMGATRMIAASSRAPERVSSGRIELWQSTMAAIRDRPLLGYGEAQLRAIPGTSQFGLPQPHNILLQLLVSWGIVGTAFLIYPALLGARRMLGNARMQGGDTLPAFFAAVALAVYSFVDGTLFHIHSTALFAACAAMALAPASAHAGPAR